MSTLFTFALTHLEEFVQQLTIFLGHQMIVVDDGRALVQIFLGYLVDQTDQRIGLFVIVRAEKFVGQQIGAWLGIAMESGIDASLVAQSKTVAIELRIESMPLDQARTNTTRSAGSADLQQQQQHAQARPAQPHAVAA